MQVRVCKKCGTQKALQAFTSNKLCAQGREHTCKACTMQRQNTWEKSAPTSHRNSYLKWRYKITIEEYEKLYAAQSGVCAICHQPETDKGPRGPKSMAVDHCHITLKIRGLLCRNCNTSLGGFKDRPELLEKALKYLKKIS
jgi:hypothetical protein